MNRLDRDWAVQNPQLSLSIAHDLHLELEDIITIFFLEGQRIALNFRVEHGRRLIRLIGGVRLLQITVLVNVNAAIGRFSGYRLTSPHPDGANHLVLEFRLPRAGELLLHIGVLGREGQTGKQGQQSDRGSGHRSGHDPAVANRWPFAEIQPA